MLKQLFNHLFSRKPTTRDTDVAHFPLHKEEHTGAGRQSQEATTLYKKGLQEALVGHYDAACAYLQRALAMSPSFFDAHICLANTLQAMGRAQDSLEHYRAAAELQPQNATLHCNLGLALGTMGALDAAVEALRTAIQLRPDLAEAHHNLGLVLEKQGRLEAACSAFIAALRLRPAYPEALKAFTTLMLRLDRARDALAVVQPIHAGHPQLGTTFGCLGFIYHKLDQLDLALSSFASAASLDPHDAEAENNYAIALQDMGRIDEALHHYQRALEIRPDFPQARWHRSLALLSKQTFATAWDDYDLRLLNQQPAPRHIPAPRWDGRPLPEGRLLVYAEQGLGDEIMFSSCLPDVLDRVGDCTIECAAKLTPLIARSFPEARVVGGNQNSDTSWVADLLPLDFAIPIGSLPQFFRRSAEAFPHHSGYLRAGNEKTQRWRTQLAALGPGPKIGISWQGGSKLSRTSLRSIPLVEWLPILSIPGAHFVSVQYTDCQTELSEFRERHGIAVTHWQAAIDDYDETAALVAALDLVISVQTAAIHLAGALGKPCWVLVSAAPEWRYGIAGEHMPWYPSVKLFRQKELQCWNEVIDSAARHLAHELPTLGTFDNTFPATGSGVTAW